MLIMFHKTFGCSKMFELLFLGLKCFFIRRKTYKSSSLNPGVTPSVLGQPFSPTQRPNNRFSLMEFFPIQTSTRDTQTYISCCCWCFILKRVLCIFIFSSSFERAVCQCIIGRPKERRVHCGYGPRRPGTTRRHGL